MFRNERRQYALYSPKRHLSFSLLFFVILDASPRAAEIRVLKALSDLRAWQSPGTRQDPPSWVFIVLSLPSPPTLSTSSAVWLLGKSITHSVVVT